MSWTATGARTRDEGGNGRLAAASAGMGRPSPFIALDNRPTALIAGAGERHILETWAERAGLRCVGAVALDELPERLSRTVAVDLVLIDLRGAALTAAQAKALGVRHELPEARLAILADLDCVDMAVRLDGPGVDMLCEPDVEQIVGLLVSAAIQAERKAATSRFHDSARANEAGRIEQLSEEVRRLAVTIERLTRQNDEMGSEAPLQPRPAYRGLGAGADERALETPRLAHGASGDAAPLGAPTPGEIRALLRARRLREQFLPAELFADPAWDMILDLMAARLSGQRVSVSSLCIAAAVPPTTALRWIRQLTERGVFARIDDPADGRRVFIELTNEAAEAFSAWTGAVRRNGGLLQPANAR